MELTKKQKSYIEKKSGRREIKRIAADLGLAEQAVREYLNIQSGVSEKTVEASKTVQPSLRQLLRSQRLTIVILLGLVFITYVNALGNGFVSDDKAILALKNIGDWGRFLKQPIHWTGELVKTISFKIGGYNPFYYRIFNILFHQLTVIGVYLLFLMLADAQYAFVVAALFAVHPLNSEAVVWIAGIQYPQAAMCLVWSLIFYYLWLQKKRAKDLIIALILYILAISSSEKAVIFPFIIIAFEAAFGRIRQHWQAVLSFFLITVVPAVLYLLLLGARLDALAKFYYQGKTLINPLLQIPIALTSYWQLLLWPYPLTLYHSELSFTQLDYAFRLAATIGLIGIAILAYKKNRLIFFGLGLFIISLLPYLTPLEIAWIVAERYVYLGAIGMFGVAGYGLWRIIKNKKTEGLGYLIFIAVMMALMARTVIRNIDWRNEDNLWIATAKTSPSDPKTHNNLGDYYGRQGNLAKSAEEFKIAIKLNPNYADAYHNLGNTYQQLGKIQEAVSSYQSAIKYNPQLWQSYQNLAAIYFNQKKYRQAEQLISEAIKINPAETNLRANLAVVYLNLGEKKLAREQFEKVLQLDPANQTAKAGLLLTK